MASSSFRARLCALALGLVAPLAGSALSAGPATPSAGSVLEVVVALAGAAPAQAQTAPGANPLMPKPPAGAPASPAPPPATPAGPPAAAEAAEGQEAEGAEPEAPPRVTRAVETLPIRQRLEALSEEIRRRSATLRREGIGDQELSELRAGLEPVLAEIRGLLEEVTPRADAAKARLRELGPKPAAGAPAESPEVTAERAERENAANELDETQRLGRSLLLEAQQVSAAVGDRRRALFTRALFQQSRSLLSPDLWVAVANAVPRELRVLQVVGGDWWSWAALRATPFNLAYVVLAILAAGLLAWIRLLIAPRLISRDPAAAEPPPRARTLAATGILLLRTLPVAAGSLLVFLALDAGNLLPARNRPIVAAILAGIAAVIFARALADAILAPGRDTWRLMRVSDAAARRVTRFTTLFAVLLMVGKVIETVNQAIAAALPVTVATRGLFALAAALLLADLLRRFATTAVEEETCLGPYVPTDAPYAGPARILGWIIVVAILAALATGYVAFASFLVDQVAWLAVLAGLLLLAIRLLDQVVAGGLRDHTRLATTLQANTGLRRRSLQQMAVLIDGVGRLLLLVAAALLALLPWGLQSEDVFASVRAAFFGFQIGDVTISFATIALGILIFALGLGATRMVQRWLDSAFLPATDLDAGLRNSISTAVGYLGFFAAAAFTLSYLGLSLDRIAIVAGALSVGIGFGLQSIVNNFVSGLILLWERPIRVGDLVVVSEGEGFVRRISVRATEIETHDRTSVIVPNSSLISGVVRNRVRGDRTGRVIVSVKVLRNQDPARAAEILSDCAREHPDVLRQPAPTVLFRSIGETWLDFDLVCFVLDVERQGRVQSDLNFAVFRRLTEEGVLPPLGPGSTTFLGLEGLETALEHIAGALGEGRRAGDGDDRRREAAG